MIRCPHLQDDSDNGLQVVDRKVVFRPIRTQAERERDEVIGAAIKACPYPGSSSTRIDVEALYDAGLLRKGDS